MVFEFDPSKQSFPPPELGNVQRPKGQGCIGCVHYLYCQEMYWYRTYNRSEGVDLNMGTKCASWSNNEADKHFVPNEYDLTENERLNIE